MDNMEVWKDIEGYEGSYQVSSYGRVRSLDRIDDNNHPLKGQIIKQHLSNRGYYRVFLYKKQKMKAFSVHRLVASAFIPNPENKACIDHISCNKEDNSVSNLRWCSHSENMCNSITYEQNLKAHESKKIPVMCCDEEGNVIKIYPSISSVKEDGHSQGIVSQCCRGQKLRHHKMLWYYAEDRQKVYGLCG